jgi:hypothetical protein
MQSGVSNAAQISSRMSNQKCEVISIKTKVKMLDLKPQLKHPSPPVKPAKPAGHPIAQLTEAIDPGLRGAPLFAVQ